MQQDYDVAISFAGEDRTVAATIAEILRKRGIRVFYDDFEKADLWGKNLYDHLTLVYRDSSRYCLMLLSKSYSEKVWTNHERRSAQARAFKENKEYLLPLKLDDTQIDGILETTGYLDYRKETPDSIADMLIAKLWGDVANNSGVQALKPKLEMLYSRIMGLCDLVAVPKGQTRIVGPGLIPKLLQETVDCFNRTKSDFVLNAPLIDRLILTQLTPVMDGFENLLGRASFLFLLNDPRMASYDFISEIPEQDFHLVHDFLCRLKVFDQYGNQRRYYQPNEIIVNWKLFENESDRYVSEPEKYVPIEGRIPFAFNINTMKRIPTKKMKDGAQIKVFIVR